MLFPVGYTVIFFFTYSSKKSILGWVKRKIKIHFFQVEIICCPRWKQNMDRMRLEYAFRYFCSCVTHIGNSAKRFHWLVPRLLPPFGEKWPAKQGANYSMVRWPMKRDRVALEEKNFPLLYWINQKALRVQISSWISSSCYSLITRRQGKLFALQETSSFSFHQ